MIIDTPDTAKDHNAAELLAADLEELATAETILRRQLRRRPGASWYLTRALDHLLAARAIVSEGPARVGLARW